jgi:hypothetical protein
MLKKIDDYKKYWKEIVIPDYEEFLKDKADIRKAFHCATALNHMADWLYHSDEAYFGKLKFKDRNGKEQPASSGPTFANCIREEFPDFEIIRGVSNAAKHLSVNQAQHPDAPTSAANTYVSSASFHPSALDDASLDKVMQEGPDEDFTLDQKVVALFAFWKNFCAKHKKSLE